MRSSGASGLAGFFEAEAPGIPMASQQSCIRGIGHGSGHAWVRGVTPNVGGAPDECRRTPYSCAACGMKFDHYYNLHPGIFNAMRLAGVPDACVYGHVPEVCTYVGADAGSASESA